jgi:hypothetical protein
VLIAFDQINQIDATIEAPAAANSAFEYFALSEIQSTFLVTSSSFLLALSTASITN